MRILAAVLLAACASSPPPRADTPPPRAPEPRPESAELLPFSREHVVAGFKRALPSIKRCYQLEGESGRTDVRLRVTPDGAVDNVQVAGAAGASHKECVARAVRAARFPAFAGEPQTVQYPIIFQ